MHGTPGIQHCNHGVAGAGGDIPRGRCVNAAEVVGQMPLFNVLRIVGREQRIHPDIGFGVFNIRLAGDFFGDRLDVTER